MGVSRGAESASAHLLLDAAKSGVDIVASDWNNQIRDAVLALVSKIPTVGAVSSAILGIFWPQSKENVFDAIKKDIVNLIKLEILEYELNLQQSELDALKLIIERYGTALTNEKANFLSNWIVQADRLSLILRQSNNDVHLIQFAVTVGLLHLSALRERLDYGIELYAEDNTDQWRKDLEDMYQTYVVDYIPAIYKKWKQWRADQIEVSTWVETRATAVPPFFAQSSHARVYDTLTGETKSFSQDLSNNTDTFLRICDAHKTRMRNDAESDMAGSISATFSFLDVLPSNSKKFPRYDKDVFGKMFKGPYSLDLYYSSRSFGLGSPVPVFRIFPTNNDYSSTSGPLTKIIVREWNSIDALQFVYRNRQGTLAGNPTGGLRHDVDVSGKVVNGFHMGFSSGILASIKIDYYDGKSSESFGNRKGERVSEFIAEGPALYKVSSWSFKVDSGPSNTYGPSVIQLQYEPQIDP